MKDRIFIPDFSCRRSRQEKSAPSLPRYMKYYRGGEGSLGQIRRESGLISEVSQILLGRRAAMHTKMHVKNPGYPAKQLKIPSGFLAAALRANFAWPFCGRAKFGFIVVSWLTLSCLSVCNYSQAAEIELSGKKNVGLGVPGEILIEVKKGVIDLAGERGRVPYEKVSIKSESMAKLNKKHGVMSIERLFSGTRKDEPSDIYVFRFSSKADIKKIISTYEKDTSVIYVEPNFVAHIQ